MTIQDLKTQLNQTGLSEEVSAKINSILDQSGEAGLNDQAREQIMDLIKLEMDADTLQADTLDQLALALDAYADESERILNQSKAEEDDILLDLEKETKELEDELNSLQSESTGSTEPAEAESVQASEPPSDDLQPVQPVEHLDLKDQAE